jgi:hypothetical protein
MLANLKIIWQFHAHPVHQEVSRYFGPRYIGDNVVIYGNLFYMYSLWEQDTLYQC